LLTSSLQLFFQQEGLGIQHLAQLESQAAPQPCQRSCSGNNPESEPGRTNTGIQTGLDASRSLYPVWCGSFSVPSPPPWPPIQQMLVETPSTIQHFIPPTLIDTLLGVTRGGMTSLATPTRTPLAQIPNLKLAPLRLFTAPWQSPELHSTPPARLLPPLSHLLLRIHEQISVAKPCQLWK
jgi:hypothetical protein